jgi:hypothetical protein
MAEDDPFDFRDEEDYSRASAADVHVYGKGHVCKTDTRGRPTPRGRSIFEIVVDAGEGFIPLWQPNATLRYRFQEQSMKRFRDPAAAKARIRQLLGEALLQWGAAAPVRFTEKKEAWDFEIAVRNRDECNEVGCVLASAFFPDQGQHRLTIYPKMFQQSRKEQLETLVHEIGHIFGLRHFFANIKEKGRPSEIFGEHSRFSIMNYGADSALTDADRSDLELLYEQAWSGQLTRINGTPIRLVKPFSSNRP